MRVTVRPATAEDMRAIETVRVTTWQAAYVGMVPDAVLSGMAGPTTGLSS